MSCISFLIFYIMKYFIWWLRVFLCVPLIRFTLGIVFMIVWTRSSKLRDHELRVLKKYINSSKSVNIIKFSLNKNTIFNIVNDILRLITYRHQSSIICCLMYVLNKCRNSENYASNQKDNIRRECVGSSELKNLSERNLLLQSSQIRIHGLDTEFRSIIEYGIRIWGTCAVKYMDLICKKCEWRVADRRLSIIIDASIKGSSILIDHSRNIDN